VPSGFVGKFATFMSWMNRTILATVWFFTYAVDNTAGERYAKKLLPSKVTANQQAMQGPPISANQQR
jgi:hypothetical protein